MPGSPQDDERRSAEREEAIPTVFMPAPRPGPRPTPPPAPRPVSAPPPAPRPVSAPPPAPRPAAPPAPPTIEALAVPTSQVPTLDSPSVAVRAASDVATVIAGRYEVEATLGEGGMGAVYRVFDRELQRRAALKMIRVEKRDEKRERRFQLEARAMAMLSHPSCVQVFDTGLDDDGAPFLVMEIVEGEPLIDVIEREGKLAPRRAALVLHAISGALQCVHDAGLIHRDVKPHNILVGPRGSKLADFGIVKVEEAETVLTADGAMIGTLAYMSPEQTGRRGIRVDARADVYSLGATLYHCLVGKAPFGGQQKVVVQAILDLPPRAPRTLDPAIPRDLEAICLRCLAKDRDERYRTAGELAEDLARFLADEPVLAREPTTAELVERAARRHKGLALVAVAAFFLALLALASLLFVRSQEGTVEARRQLAVADAYARAGKLREAEEAYLRVTEADSSLAGEAHARARTLRAGRVAQEAQDGLARAKDLLARAGRGGSDARDLAASARRAAVGCEQALRDALALAPGRADAERLREAAAALVPVLAEEDPAEAERLAVAADALATAAGLAPIEPGAVSFAPSPSQASVRLYRFELDPVAKVERLRAVGADGKLAPATSAAGPGEPPPADALAASAPLALPPGDYLAVARAEGCLETRVPFSLWRRRKLALDVALPRATKVETELSLDLVWVPRGEARSGRELETVADVPGFFVGRREVTNELWLRFLEKEQPNAVSGIPGFAPAAGSDPVSPQAAREAWAKDVKPDAPVTGTSAAARGDFLKWVRNSLPEATRDEWDARLPTLDQLHRALRGPFRRAFPWGDAFDPGFLAPGAAADESWAGVRGLAGGVPELTSDLAHSGSLLLLGATPLDLEAPARAFATTARGGERKDGGEPAGFRVVLVERR